MRMIKVTVSNIEYVESTYSQELKSSIERIGLSFPLKLEVTSEGKYLCRDGNKRLTIINEFKLYDQVNAIVVNNGDNRSNDCWRGRNHH